jgi:phosphate transport system protein
MSSWLSSESESSGLPEIERLFSEMLEDGRHVFDAAANALLGGTDPEAIRKDLFATDRRINQTEQALRRKLVVHGTVHGAVHFPRLLVLMSVAKDAERIGDYGKNLFDLAVLRPWLGGADRLAELVELKDEISRLLVRAKGLYERDDIGAARAFLGECDRVEDHCDAIVRGALAAESPNHAGLALALRYFKRVTSHASNIVTALVVPLDKLDFHDES